MGVCCRCCCGSKSRCCCCGGKRGATAMFGLLGLLLSSAVIAPPVYIYKTDQEYNKMFPIFKFGRQLLAEFSGGDPIFETTTAMNTVTDGTVTDQILLTDEEKHTQTYK